MRYLFAVLALVLGVQAVAPVALAQSPPLRPFVVPLTAEEEVPRCAAAGSEASGVAVFRVRDQAAGTVDYEIFARPLPGAITAAHIHIAPRGEPGPVVQPLPLEPGAEYGAIGRGTFANPALVAALLENPSAYYVNVHSSVCPPGVIRGQFGEGPA